MLKMRGDYLAIATLGFGEIIRILVLSDWLRPVDRRCPGHRPNSQYQPGRLQLFLAATNLLFHSGRLSAGRIYFLAPAGLPSGESLDGRA